MSLQSIVAYNSIMVVFQILSSVCVGVVLLKQISLQVKKPVLSRFFILILCVIISAALAAVMYKAGLFRMVWVNALMSYVQLLVDAFVLRLIFRVKFQVCWVIVALNGVIIDFATAISFGMSSRTTPFNLSIPQERNEYLFYGLIVGPAILAIVLFVLYKMNAGVLYIQWMEHKNIWIWGTVILSAYPAVVMGAAGWLQRRGLGGIDSNLVSNVMVLGVLIIFNYVSREELQRKKLAEQQLNIWQQNLYIETLEGMQEEMRRFRHDYKNMMAGMYQQAQEENFVRISEFIQEMTEDFDSQIGGEVQRMSQLRNVHMTELKGLLIMKLREMEKEGICCELEAARPFYETSVRTTDLCRCMGILIDNAMDEVRGKPDGKIHIMISSQKEYTTFRVKNVLYHPVDFGRIWQKGYSTKGENRGIGLASYRKILAGYDNVLSAASVQEAYFIQELKINNNNGYLKVQERKAEAC